MPRLVLRDHYLVLGVSNDATEDEIKKTFRQRARQLHPDLLGPDATKDEVKEAEELFKEANEAYETLNDPERRHELDRWLERSTSESEPSWDDDSWFTDFYRNTTARSKPSVPEPDRFEHEGVWIYVVYGLNYWSDRVTATVKVSLNDVFSLETDPVLNHDAEITQYEVVDGQGDTVGNGYSLQGMRDSYRRFKAEESRNASQRTWKKRLAELRISRDELAQTGHIVTTLDRLLHEAVRKEADAFNWVYSDGLGLTLYDRDFALQYHSRGRRYGNSRDSVVQAIREAEKELDRLKQLEVSEVLLAELMAGKITHPSVRTNNEVIAAYDILSIRTGGEVAAYTQEAVLMHYQTRLEGIMNEQDLLMTDLSLPDDREMIDEMIREGLLDLAPETIQISGAKGDRSYPVEYWYQEDNGVRLPVGVVTVPLVVYERNCSKCGVKSTFPELPHGIQLLVRVKIGSGDEEVTSDPYPDGPSLKTEVTRCLKRKLRKGVEPGEIPPPWFTGRVWRP